MTRREPLLEGRRGPLCSRADDLTRRVALYRGYDEDETIEPALYAQVAPST